MNYDAVTNKLIILFVMDKVEMPLTENSIIEICAVKNNWINYMDCLDLLYQLSEAKLIYKTQCKEGEMRYTLTFEGRDSKCATLSPLKAEIVFHISTREYQTPYATKSLNTQKTIA